jgi:isoquinoline 1-oxidoreductase subunit alpha
MNNSWLPLANGSKQVRLARRDNDDHKKHKERHKKLCAFCVPIRSSSMPTYQLNVNGQRREVTVDASTPLLWVLREDLKMTGTKFGCGISACGACTVHLADVATRSCVVPISHVGDRPIVTIEGIGQDAVGRAVQDAWVEIDVVQCGYCQSGQIMAAVALLKHTPKPTEKNIEESMGGNICRCATYPRIRQAINTVAQRIK